MLQWGKFQQPSRNEEKSEIKSCRMSHRVSIIAHYAMISRIRVQVPIDKCHCNLSYHNQATFPGMRLSFKDGDM